MLLFHPGIKTEFSPIGLLKVPVAHFSRAFWRVAFPSIELTTPPNLVSSINLVREVTTSSSWLLMKTLNSVCASLDPKGMSLVTSHQWFGQFYLLLCPVIHSIPHQFGGKKIMGGCVKHSIKSRFTTSTALSIALISSILKMKRRNNLEWSSSKESASQTFQVQLTPKSRHKDPQTMLHCWSLFVVWSLVAPWHYTSVCIILLNDLGELWTFSVTHLELTQDSTQKWFCHLQLRKKLATYPCS